MDWLLNSFQKFKSRSNRKSNSKYKTTVVLVHTWDRSNHYWEEEKVTKGNWFLNIRMRLKKKCKVKTISKPGLKPKGTIVKKGKSVRTKIIHPKRVKSKPVWVDRLLNNTKIDESFGEYLHQPVATEAVNKIYSSQFMKCDHFNLVGEDQNLGPVVLSVKFSSQAKEAATSKTSLILRLSTGMAYHQWSQFQLSQASSKSPFELVELAFPTLSVGKLLPVLCPDAWQVIACYDENDGGAEATFNQIKEKDWTENLKDEVAKRDRELKALQVKLITGTCKFLELSVWDFDAYENFFFSKKKPTFVPKYLSFTMPNVMKTPKAFKSSKSPSFNIKSVNEVKSPKFIRITKSLLQIENDQSELQSPSITKPRILGSDDHSLDLDSQLAVSETDDYVQSKGIETIPPHMLANKPVGDFSWHSATSIVPSILEPDLNDRLMDLSIESLDQSLGLEPGLSVRADSDDVLLMKLKLTLIKFKMEKDELMEKNFALEKEKQTLQKNEARLVRELASAKTIIENLKNKVSRHE